MDIRSVTVREAILRGERMIGVPSKAILVVSSVLCVLLLFILPSWWVFLLPPIGIVVSLLYTMYFTPKWRIWAYEHVTDIHQLQRSAELGGLLVLRSHGHIGYFTSRGRKQKIKTLQRRFSEASAFEDDLSIPKETAVYAKGLFARGKAPLMILNESGITLPSDGFFAWHQIHNERIVRVTYNRLSPQTGARYRSGARFFFRFECPPQQFEIGLSTILTKMSFLSINIALWELDLLFYIYRGRFERKQKAKGNERK